MHCHCMQYKEIEMEYQLTLTVEDLTIINAALVHLPYKDVVELIDKINNQIKQNKE